MVEEQYFFDEVVDVFYDKINQVECIVVDVLVDCCVVFEYELNDIYCLLLYLSLMGLQFYILFEDVFKSGIYLVVNIWVEV